MAVSQPPIPGTVLLFTAETLRFSATNSDSVGNLQEPSARYLIIDGQHRLAALRFYLKEHPAEAATINVPCVIFDGRSEDFAAEMFVIINSTPTRINKSHLVDLYERVSWAEPDRRFAARLVEDLYSEDDSPLQYRINRLGGRSQQDKWILQAELFNELHRWVSADWKKIRLVTNAYREGERYYGIIRDFFKAAQKVWGDTWGNDAYMVTKPVTLKALVRVCADLARADADPAEGRVKRWEERLAPWKEQHRAFRSEGFYERFPRQRPDRARRPRAPRPREDGGHRDAHPRQNARLTLFPFGLNKLEVSSSARQSLDTHIASSVLRVVRRNGRRAEFS